MIISDLLAYVDAVKPNSFDTPTKIIWLNEIEGMVQTDIMLVASADIIAYAATDTTVTLLVPPPHDKLYRSYLCAMIDFANGEYTKYNNAMQMFNRQYNELVEWYARVYRPADGIAVWQGYYISAYGIAVSHGYIGDEVAWLTTLKGGTGGTGDTGDTGKSAYDLAVEGGYMGIEAAFNAKIASDATKLDATDIINDTFTGGATSVLSAEAGKWLGMQLVNIPSQTYITEKAKTVDMNAALTLRDDAIAAIASGSPKAVYATVAALTAAIPAGNTNVYVVTADGNWYYWNGTAWTAGGMYQATGIADKSISGAKLDVRLNYATILLSDSPTLPNFNTAAKTLTFYTGTLGILIFAVGTYYIVSGADVVIDLTVPGGSSAGIVLFNIGTNTFRTLAYSSFASALTGEVLIATFRYVLNGIYNPVMMCEFTIDQATRIADNSVTNAKLSGINNGNISFSSYSKDMVVVKSGTTIIITITSISGIFITFSDMTIKSLGRYGNATILTYLPVFGNGIIWQDGTKEVIIITIPHNSCLVYDKNDNTFKVVLNTATLAHQTAIAFCHNGELKFSPLYEYGQFWDSKTNVTNISSLDTRVSALDTRVSAIDTRVSAIESDGAIPSYWNTEIDAVISSVATLQRTAGINGMSFAFITDIHNTNNAGKSPPLIKKIMDSCHIKYWLSGGDIATDGALGTKAATIADLLDIESKFVALAGNWLRVEGNHDVAYSTLGAPNYYKQNLTPGDMYDVYYRDLALNNNVKSSPSGDYFFADDDTQKIRYIGLDSQDKLYSEDVDGRAIDNKMWSFTFRQDQITWFANTALNVPTADWSIVVFSHVPPGELAMTGSDLIIANYDLMVGLLNAFSGNTSYTGVGINTTYPATITADYTSKGGEVICWVSGHVHRDKLFTISGINVITTLHDSLAVMSGEATKTAGTATEQAFDIFTINKTTRTVNTTRVGAGADRSFTY